MTVRQTHSQPEQPAEGLFPVYTEMHDGIVHHSFGEPEAEAGDIAEPVMQQEPVTLRAAVDARQRAGHLIHSLNALAQASKRRGFAIASETPGLQEPIAERYPGDHLKGVKSEARSNERNFARTARDEFVAAFRLGGEDDEDEVDRAYIAFKHKYGGSANHAALVAYRKNLKKIQTIPGPKVVDEAYVHEDDPETSIMLGEGDEREPLLTTREKMMGIRDDERAGFLPETHREKSQAIELLDYQDNPLYPGGVHHRLQEIYDHQVRVFKEKGFSHHQSQLEARKAVDSVLEEYGDYLSSARYAYRQLAALRQVVDNTPNPNLTLAEAIADEDVSFDPRIIVQYMDLLGLREGKPFSLAFDPLVTTENRAHPTERKNKVIEDPYTAEAAREGVEEHVADVLDRLTVGPLRGVVGPAMENQLKRGTFWKNVLSGVRFAYGPRAKEIIEAA